MVDARQPHGFIMLCASGAAEFLNDGILLIEQGALFIVAHQL